MYVCMCVYVCMCMCVCVYTNDLNVVATTNCISKFIKKDNLVNLDK